MDLVRLRDVLCPQIVSLKDRGNTDDLQTILNNLSLPIPTNTESKKKRIISSLERLSDADLPDVAQHFLELYPPAPSIRNQIQDILWADTFALEISKRFRREVACALTIDELYFNVKGFDALLEQLWVLNDNDLWAFWEGVDRSLRAEINKHIHQNPDWSVEELFEKLGAFNASNRRFILFLEGLASPDVRPDEAAQRRFVQIVNGPLRRSGLEMRESDIEDGYPVFKVVSTHMAPKGRPKNLIFASSVKPDLRFKDAVNNDIEIVTNADKVLIYDRPIGIDGLTWSDLQSWWSEANGIADDEIAKRELYRRLKESLPKESPPQIALFESFYRGFGSAVPGLPALLPEVWLHWDPKTVKERGADALLRFRMDFLLLLPHGIRIVVEVDGKQHYARNDGRADSALYAKMMAADRELRLAGYEVFRFGAEELTGAAALEIGKIFFSALFKRYGIIVP